MSEETIAPVRRNAGARPGGGVGTGIRVALVAAGLSALALTGGCAEVQTAWQGAQTLYAKVQLYYQGAPKTVFALESGYTLIQTAAATFKTVACPGVTSLGGKCATIVPKLRDLNHRALAIIAPVEKFVRANPKADASTLITNAEANVALIAQEMTALGVTPAKD